MNSAERVGLKSICFGSPGFHGTPSYTYPGQTLLLGRGLLLSSPPGPHAFSVYRAFCRASMSSVPSFLLNGNKTLPGHLSASGAQSRSIERVLATVATMALIQRNSDAWRLLPFLHPEKMSHSFTHHQLSFKPDLSLELLPVYEEPVILPH